MNSAPASRRPIRSRNTRWASAFAVWLSRRGIRPNLISLLSVVFAGGAGGALYLSGVQETTMSRASLVLLGGLLIQGRLLCNLFDGMVAVEGGFKTKSGEIFNELPDRFADALILIGAGYALPLVTWMPLAGWTAAVLSLIAAYIRALGAVAGGSQQFCGPMAKQQRMATVTVACVAAAIALWTKTDVPIMGWALVLISTGCLVTIFRRTRRIIKELESR